MKVQDLLEAVMYGVVSSNIAEVGWEDEILTVEFLSGAQYEYYDCPEEIFNEFLEAPSKGRFFWRNIRGIYRYRKIRGGF